MSPTHVRLSVLIADIHSSGITVVTQPPEPEASTDPIVNPKPGGL